MIFISDGHNSQSKTIKQDPGAINTHKVKEGDLTIEFIDLVSSFLTLKGIAHKRDSKEENLQMYTDRIETGDGSVVYEAHLDSGPESAQGSTVIVEIDADRLDKACAKEILDETVKTLGTKSRGIITEADTRHKRLALMKENGIVVLHEICFITNESDIAKYQAKKKDLAKAVADILIKYEKIIP